MSLRVFIIVIYSMTGPKTIPIDKGVDFRNDHFFEHSVLKIWFNLCFMMPTLNIIKI